MNEKTETLLRNKKELTDQECKKAMDFAVEQVEDNLSEFTDQFKKAYSEDGFYYPTGNVNWTTGFWTGQIVRHAFCLATVQALLY